MSSGPGGFASPGFSGLTDENLTAIERGVLGACLADGDKVMNLVGEPPDLFTALAHRELCATLTEMWLAQKRIDYGTVDEAMQKAGRTRLKFSDLAAMTITSLSLNLEGDLDLLRRNRMRRKVLDALARHRQSLVERCVDPEEVISQAVVDLVSLVTPAEGRLQELWPAVNQVILAGEAGQVPDTIKTGFAQLDALLGGGLRRKTLTVVAGRTSMGKSAFALQVGLNAARAKRRVLLFSVEMSTEALATRITATEAGEEPMKLRLAPRSVNWEKVRRATAPLQDSTLWIYDDPAMTSGKAAVVARELKVRNGLDLVIVDYLGRLGDALQSGQNRNQQLGQMTRAFAILGRQLDCAVILVSQLSRAPEARADKRPVLSDLRDSGEVEQDADTVLFLFRTGYYDKPDMDEPKDEREAAKREARKHKAELIIAKQREGSTATIQLYWDAERVRFLSLDIRSEGAKVGTSLGFENRNGGIPHDA